MRTNRESLAYIIVVSIDHFPEDFEAILKYHWRAFLPGTFRAATQQIRQILESDFYEPRDLERALVPFINPEYAETHSDVLQYGLPTWRRINEIMSRRKRLRKRKQATTAQKDLEELLLNDRPHITEPNRGAEGR